MRETQGYTMSEGALARPDVVVVGGGYGGVNVAKALDTDTNVVLIEPKDAFVHNIASLRALVEPAFLSKIFLPYEPVRRDHGPADRAGIVEPPDERRTCRHARRGRGRRAAPCGDRGGARHGPPG